MWLYHERGHSAWSCKRRDRCCWSTSSHKFVPNRHSDSPWWLILTQLARIFMCRWYSSVHANPIFCPNQSCINFHKLRAWIFLPMSDSIEFRRWKASALVTHFPIVVFWCPFVCENVITPRQTPGIGCYVLEWLCLYRWNWRFQLLTFPKKRTTTEAV